MAIHEPDQAPFPPITEDDWADFEIPAGYHAEIIRGELVLSPSPSRRHVNIQNRLLGQLRPPAGYEAIFGAEWKLSERGLVVQAPQPDLIVVPRSNGPVVEAPLWALEVLSPSDHQKLANHPHLTRIQGKRLDYAANGLQDYVEIDLVNAMWILRYELHDGELTLVQNGPDRLTTSTPFGYTIDLPALLA